MLSVLILSLILGESFGFDEYISCDSQARSSRSMELPPSCDMSVNNFCFDRGDHYPDKAIKRFLRENLGLMKRMSSDMDGREVVREMRSGFNMWTEANHFDDEDFKNEEDIDATTNFQFNMMPPGENIFNGLKYNIKYGSGLATIQNVRDETVKNTSPGQTSTSTTKTTTSQTTMIVTTVQSTSSDDTTQTQPDSPTFTTARKDTTNDFIEPSTVTEQYQTSTVMDQETTYEMQSRETPTEPPFEESEFYDYYQEEVPVNDVVQQPAVVQEEIPEPEYLEYPVPQVNELPVDDLIEEILEEEIKEEEEVEEEEMYVGESVNACEVDITIEAPFYANNTRNEPLALLNLYPFEQYVHMERCKSEYDEMLCRPGCRCEQQYRLHRLLAFDPKNECRGIFSDWFRFPSYCICKCYNSAKKFKELVRSPKSHKMMKKTSKKSKSRLDNHRLMTVSGMDNMPAVFPYEGLAMISDAQKQNDLNIESKDYRVPRRLDQHQGAKSEDIISQMAAEDHIDNTVESDQIHYKKLNKQARYLGENFYFNQPIVDFKLADGTMGSVEQVPRK